MTNNEGSRWNRLITIASAFGIPIVGLAFTAVVLITKMDDKISNIQIKQTEQGSDIRDIKSDAKALRTVVDSLAQRQKDYQRENEYRWQLEGHKNK